jgi:hypothetical protein
MLPPTVPMLGLSSLSVGEWEGTTSQGKPITFTVSRDEKATSIILGYDFNFSDAQLQRMSATFTPS